MANTPSTGISRWDLSLTFSEFNLRANRMGFGALRLFPLLAVDMLGDSSFLKVVLQSLMKPQGSTVRKPDGSFARDEFEWSKDTYNLEHHGAEEGVDEENVRRYSDVVRLEWIARERAVDRLLRYLEVEAQALIGAWSQNRAVSTPWTNAASGKPIGDINQSIENIAGRTGVTPNAVQMTDYMWRAIQSSNDFLDRIQMGSNDNPANVSAAGFLSLFDEIDTLIITKGWNNTAENETAGPTLGRIWPNSEVFIGCVRNDGLDGDLESAEPCIGRTLFNLEDGDVPGTLPGEESLIMEEYTEEKVLKRLIRARNYRQIKVLHTNCGERLTSVAA